MDGMDARQLGTKLRLIREVSGLSQRELAKRAGVTNSSISMIEQGQVNPSVQSLAKVLAGIPMSLAHFFSTAEVTSQNVIYDTDTLERYPRPYGFMQLVGEQISHREVNVRHCYFEPRGDSGDVPIMGHVDQAGWVCEGELLVAVGSQVETLKAGQSFYLKAYTPCRVTNLSKSLAARLLVASREFNPVGGMDNSANY